MAITKYVSGKLDRTLSKPLEFRVLLSCDLQIFLKPLNSNLHH
jgi:hypothetical protein